MPDASADLNVTRPRPGPWRIVDIIDGRKLRVQLTAAALENLGDDAARRARVLDLLHSALFRGRMIAQERLAQGADGLDTARLLAAVQDEVLSALFDFTTTLVFRARNPTQGERLSVFATGGYGRAALAPSSDIDLLFVRQYKQTPWAESVIEFMLYALWDMGLKVGHAFRTPEECVRLSRSDVTIKTSLLDARFLFGDAQLGKSMQEKFKADCLEGRAADFIADKLAERDARHKRHGDTRYLVEPNVKDGPGGLRDLQTIFWIAKHMFGGETLEEVLDAGPFTDHERRAFLRAGRFLWTVRCHLHFITGRAEERISFDLQPELAARLGYADRTGRLGVERFMKRYFIAAKDVGWLSRAIAAKLESEHQASAGLLKRWLPSAGPKPLANPNFVIDGGRLSIADEAAFTRDPNNLLHLFALAGQEGAPIHPAALVAATRAVKRFKPDMRGHETARALFLAILLDNQRPAALLREMNETGLLGRVLPEFGGIVAQTQFNMYHHYTVDEHTLRTIEAMSNIEWDAAGEGAHRLATALFRQIENRRALYLAMLLHDTGKGHGDQQVEGAKTARAAALRLGLGDAEAELVAWLVGNHLEMSETAQKRDLSDPRTIGRFAELVGSLERLRLLYILTIADIRGVGPGVWNGWKSQLLEELYRRTAAALRGGRSDERGLTAQQAADGQAAQEALARNVGAVPAVMADMDPAYWTGFDADELAWHAGAFRRATWIAADARRRPDGAGATLFVSCPDRVALFADLARAIAAEGANIAGAQIFTSPSGHIIDVFTLHDASGGPFGDDQDARLQSLLDAVKAAAAKEGPQRGPSAHATRREAAFLVAPAVKVLNEESATHTVIEIEARDRPGLLYEVAEVFADLNLTIHSAHVGSYGERVFDAFYVQTSHGGKLFDEGEKAVLRQRILAVLEREDPEPPKTPARALAQSPSADSF